MDREILIAFLTDLGADVKLNYPNINCGGCGVYAYLVGKQLEKLDKNIKVEAITNVDIFGDEISPMDALDYIKDETDIFEWVDNGVSFGHIALCIVIDDKSPIVFDTDHIGTGHYRFEQTESIDFEFGNGFTMEQLKPLVESAKGWNESFDRDDIPYIEQMIEGWFEELTVSA